MTVPKNSYDTSYHCLKGIQRVGNSSERASFDYTAADGRLTKTTYGNGASATYDYCASVTIRFSFSPTASRMAYRTIPQPGILIVAGQEI